MDCGGIVDLVAGLHGRFYVLRHDMVISRSMALYGEWTESEFDLLQPLLRAGDTVIDVGANIGTLTVPFARAVGAAGSVLAFEPQPGLFRLLAANTLLNGVLNARLFPMACGSADATISIAELEFLRPENYGALSLDALAAATSSRALRRNVPVRRLDDLFDAASLRLIKIDVEGMEAEVVKGAASIIHQHRPFLYVENENPGAQSVAAIEAVEALDYRLFWHLAPQYNLRNFRANPTNVFGSNVCVNMFCAPNEIVMEAKGLQPIASAREHPRLPR